MHSIDFLPVESLDGPSSKSGDAIVANFTTPSHPGGVVMVVDGGYSATGQAVIDHIDKYCDQAPIDLVICTHPDGDHLNGLLSVLENRAVGELMLHLPWKHNSGARELGNYDNLVKLYDLAVSRGVTVTEPFTGVSRFDGAVQIMGPTLERYRVLLDQAVDEARSGAAESRLGLSAAKGVALLSKAKVLAERAIGVLPFETLSNEDDTGPRNQMSVITLLDVDDERHLLTGDAGIASLDAAATHYESVIGSLSQYPLGFFQVPHHGSHHNVGPEVLNRLLGPKGAGFTDTSCFISSAKASEKHPSPKVVNALIRRGGRAFATEGKGICHGGGWRGRPGWTPISPLPPLDEDDN